MFCRVWQLAPPPSFCLSFVIEHTRPLNLYHISEIVYDPSFLPTYLLAAAHSTMRRRIVCSLFSLVTFLACVVVEINISFRFIFFRQQLARALYSSSSSKKQIDEFQNVFTLFFLLSVVKAVNSWLHFTLYEKKVIRKEKYDEINVITLQQ